jgi:hypothetical protein
MSRWWARSPCQLGCRSFSRCSKVGMLLLGLYRSWLRLADSMRLSVLCRSWLLLAESAGRRLFSGNWPAFTDAGVLGWTKERLRAGFLCECAGARVREVSRHNQHFLLNQLHIRLPAVKRRSAWTAPLCARLQRVCQPRAPVLRLYTLPRCASLALRHSRSTQATGPSRRQSP